jgi:APA family basic amino acid/polyamine antiporter
VTACSSDSRSTCILPFAHRAAHWSFWVRFAALLALSGTYEELYSLFVFAAWIFFALTAIALLRLRRKEPNLARPYRVWVYPWTPLIFLVAAVALTINLRIVQPVRSYLELAVILGGIPLFYRWRKPLALGEQTSHSGS